LVDTPTSPQSAYFSDNRSSYAESQWSSPPTPHAKPIRRKSSDISAHPSLPSGAAAPSSMIPYEQQQQPPKPRRGSAMLTPTSLSPPPRHYNNTPDQLTTTTPSSSHRRGRAQRHSSVTETMGDVTPTRARDPLRSRQPVDSDDDISVNTFYTATSQPRSARARR
jgi:hypothetical protein